MAFCKNFFNVDNWCVPRLDAANVRNMYEVLKKLAVTPLPCRVQKLHRSIILFFKIP